MEARNLHEARSDYLGDVATEMVFLIRHVKSKFLKTIHGTVTMYRHRKLPRAKQSWKKVLLKLKSNNPITASIWNMHGSVKVW